MTSWGDLSACYTASLHTERGAKPSQRAASSPGAVSDSAVAAPAEHA